MPRKLLPPHLYFDRGRKAWVIRDGVLFIRTGAAREDRAAAEIALLKYNTGQHPQVIGYIYFITAVHPNYPIKIGFTEKLSAVRIRALQTGCPYALYFLGHTRGTMRRERDIHLCFDHLRLRGEWFAYHPELIAFINETCSNATELVENGKVIGKPQVFRAVQSCLKTEDVDGR